MSKINASIIGYGGMGNGHRQIMQHGFPEDIEIAGVFDIDENALNAAKEKGLNVYSSRQHLLEDEKIDFVVVATPNDVHKEIVIDALEHKKTRHL